MEDKPENPTKRVNRKRKANDSQLTKAKKSKSTVDEIKPLTVPKKTVKNVEKSSELSSQSEKLENDKVSILWDEVEKLSQVEKVPINVAKNFVKLLNDGCTLAFIARYRKTAVEYLMPDRLQELFETYQNLVQLKKKINTVIASLKKNKKLTPDVEKSILNAQSLAEIDLVHAPLKSTTATLAERARMLGLEPYALRLLNGEYLDLNMLCTEENDLNTVEKVETQITYIIADIIYKDPRVLDKMRSLKEETRFIIQSTRTKSSMKPKERDENNKKNDLKSDPDTYKLYFDWKCNSQSIKPHQTLALNRGEDEKILSIKVIVPDWFYNQLERFCLSLWQSNYWVRGGLNDAYTRLIRPWITRHARSELTQVAHKEAVKTFTINVEKYLLTEPLKNRVIAGLDPGFKAGCKVGIININGGMLDACTIYPDLRRHHTNDAAAIKLRELFEKYKVEVIGLGNGTACRETEAWLKSHQISETIPIIIVPEQGASVYSISKEAQKEHLNMDPNLISALSIARRVLDPLGELIKVEPRSLGVGMYQHDICVKQLDSALDCAVEKIVSLVGVDINTASHAMLRRISGLSDSRAKNIIGYRETHKGFKSRAELLKVASIGKITYQQCAGFLRVLGGTEPLDATIVHPESYKVAKSFAKILKVDLKHLTKPDFPTQIESKMSTINKTEICESLSVDIGTLELIISAFKQKVTEDNIISFCKPVYSLAVQKIDQLKEGVTLIGVVRNVVPFGCFVDCGVGDNGLIHNSKLNGLPTPKLGDRVSVTVISTPKPRKLQLQLEEILD